MSNDILRDAIRMAKEGLVEHMAYEEMDREERKAFLEEPHDTIHELADGAVPVYYSELLEAASQYNGLATDVPELGPAFDGEATPVNIIGANFYEAVEAALFEEATRLKEEIEDDEDNGEEDGKE